MQLELKGLLTASVEVNVRLYHSRYCPWQLGLRGMHRSAWLLLLLLLQDLQVQLMCLTVAQGQERSAPSS